MIDVAVRNQSTEQPPSGRIEPALRIEPAAEAKLPTAAEPLLTVIEPASGWRLINVRELWRYRELLYFFTWRDVKIRYKQTLLGAAWAVIQPFMMMVVFTIFLGRMANVDSGNFPYPVFVYAGLLPWTFFATAISSAGNSVVGARAILTKVYFPRLAIPFASVGAAVVDFAIAFGMLLALMIYYGIQPGWSILLVPGLVVLTAVAALGVGTLLATLNVAFRDFKYTIPFLVQIWMFATPTVYMHVDYQTEQAAVPQTDHADNVRSASAPGNDVRRPSKAVESARSTALEGHRTVPVESPTHGARSDGDHAVILAEDPMNRATTSNPHTGDVAKEGSAGSKIPAGLRPLLHLNPLTGIIAFFRAAVLGGPLPWTQLGYAAALVAVLFCGGIAYFRRVENSFADIV